MLETMIIIILLVLFWRLWLVLAITGTGIVVTLFILFVILAALSGCASRVPVLSADCEIERYKQQWETVEECKMASDKREDSRFKKEQREIEWQIEAAQCRADGDAWVRRSRWSYEGVCRPWDML
jgi:hypothetical protein